MASASADANQQIAIPAYLDAKAQVPLPTVFAGHPRLIVGGYRGMSVATLKKHCATSAAMSAECAKIGGEHILGDAMAYLLRDDGAAAARAVAALRQPFECSSNSEHSPVGGYALAYDWVYGSIKDAAVRREIAQAIGDCALDTAGPDGLGGNGPHLWHGYTALASGVALAALAVDDDFPKRRELLGQAVQLFRRNALEAYALVGGAWPEGYNYERSHFFSADPPDQYVMDALRAWDSAVEQDHPNHASLFETIQFEEGDWLRGLAYHLVYGTIPPYGTQKRRTLLRGGDMPTGQAYPNKQYRPYVDSIATVYNDWFLAEWGRTLEKDWSFVGGEGTYHSIHRYGLPYNVPVDVPIPQPDPANTPPLGRIWGRADLGYVIARSRWFDEGVILGYRAGKWMTGHQHMDQGHIDLWYKGPIAVDAGVYANWGTPHREGYYMRTVSHNTLLIHMAGELFDQHPSFGTKVNDDGQRVHTYNRLGCAQCVQSVAEWRQNIGKGMHFEAGKIEAFETGPPPAEALPGDLPIYTVIASDLTAAYNSTAYSTAGNKPKVELVQRDVTMVGNAVLVADRVRTAPGAEAPRFVLHFPKRPDVAGLTAVQGALENGISTSDKSGFDLDNGSGGSLRGETFVGGPVKTTVIGGPDYRYWADGANRVQGAAGLEGAPAEAGLWRIEIGPADNRRETVMVNGLALSPAGISEPWGVHTVPVASDPALAASTTLAFRAGPSLPGHEDLVVMNGSIPRGYVRQAELEVGLVDVSKTVLLRDLVPNARYAIRWDGEVKTTPPITSSAEGVIVFEVNTGTRLELGYCPPPAAAGAGWQALCGGAPLPTGTPGGSATATAIPPATSTATPNPPSTPTAGRSTATATPAPPSRKRALVPWASR